MQAKPDESPMVPWTAFWVFLFVLDTALYIMERSKTALCQMMLVKRNLRIIGDQVDQFLLIFFS